MSELNCMLRPTQTLQHQSPLHEERMFCSVMCSYEFESSRMHPGTYKHFVKLPFEWLYAAVWLISCVTWHCIEDLDSSIRKASFPLYLCWLWVSAFLFVPGTLTSLPYLSVCYIATAYLRAFPSIILEMYIFDVFHINIKKSRFWRILVFPSNPCSWCLLCMM